MSWLIQKDGAASPLERYFGWRPELLEHFKAFYDALWDERLLDPALLEMLRLRIAQLHGCEAELAVRYIESGLSEDKASALADWRESHLFDDTERTLLAYAEQIPFAHHAISDEDAATVRDTLGEDGFVAYTIAVSLFDALCRVRMVMDFPSAAGDSASPPAAATAVLR